MKTEERDVSAEFREVVNVLRKKSSKEKRLTGLKLTEFCHAEKGMSLTPSLTRKSCECIAHQLNTATGKWGGLQLRALICQLFISEPIGRFKVDSPL